MNDVTDSLQDLVETLKRERDELRLQLKLARMDFSDQWDAAEVKWRNLEDKLQDVGHQTANSGKLIAHEIAEAYRRMRDTIKS